MEKEGGGVDVLCRLEEIKAQKIIDDKRAELYSSDRGKK